MSNIFVLLTVFAFVSFFRMVHFEQKGLHITKDQMWSLAIAHYRQQLIMQLYVIILGLDVLGNPYGLFKDITTGISDLFYEPVMVQLSF